MVNLQRICIVKICEIFKIVEQDFFFVLKAANWTLDWKIVLKFSLFFLTHSLPMHPSSNRCKHQKTVSENLKPFFFCASTFWIYHNLPIYTCPWYGSNCSVIVNSLVFSLQIAQHHQKWLILAFIHGLTSSKRFCLRRFSSFFRYLQPHDKHRTDSLFYPLFYTCNDGLAYVNQW